MSLQSLADQHRNAILTREKAAAREITAQYHDAELRLIARILTLYSQQGQPDLHAMQRLQQALTQVQGDMTHFSLNAQNLVTGQARLAAHSGQQDANLLLQHKLGKVQGVFNQPMPQAGAALSQSLDTGPIAKRFAKLPPDAVKRAKATLLYGWSQGWGPREIARKLRADLAIQLNDALRISRTESMNAYRDGTLSIYRANSDVVTGWEWLAEGDACPEICLPANGSKHSLGESMDSHPNCRCTMLPITLSYEEILAA